MKHTAIVIALLAVTVSAVRAQTDGGLLERQRKRQESVRNAAQKRMQDSLARLTPPFAKVDSLKPSTQDQMSRLAKQRQASFASPPPGPVNLDFENRLSGWTRMLYFNPKRVPMSNGFTGGGDLLGFAEPMRAEPDDIVPAEAISYDLFSTIYGAQGVPSKYDPDPFQLTGIVDQESRTLLISKAANPNRRDKYGDFPLFPAHVGDYIARIGNPSVGFFKDGKVNVPWPPLYEQESMSYTFVVPANEPYLLVNYAVVLEDPNADPDPTKKHLYSEDRTYFKITLQDAAGNDIPCAAYDVYAGGSTNVPGFLTSPVVPDEVNPAFVPNLLDYYIYYKPWTTSLIKLPAPGTTVTVTFSTGDCLSGGHWGYAYVDAKLSSDGIVAKQGNVDTGTYCKGEPIDFSSLLTGKYTTDTYKWIFDGTTVESTAQSTSYTYTSNGPKTVTLIINDQACSTISRTINIVDGPVAGFTVNPPMPVPGGTVTVTGSNIIDVNWGDGTSSSLLTHVYANSGTYKIVITKSTGGGCQLIETAEITVTELCTTLLPNVVNTDGSFKLDRVTGNVVYMRNTCPIQVIMPCIMGSANTSPKVVSATANVFSDVWSYSDYSDNTGVNFPATSNLYDKGERGKWRLKSTYTHNTALTPEDKNSISGTYSLQNFNWRNENSNNKTKWLLGAEVTSYSPHGDPLSEKNILGIESSARFGYNNALPYLTAKNSSPKAVLFESFEMVYANGKLEANMKVPSGGSLDDIRKGNLYFAHSGFQSWRLPSGGQVTLDQFSLTSSERSKGLTVKVWVRLGNLANSYPALVNNATTNVLTVRIKNKSGTAVPLKIVSRTGDWILCEGTLSGLQTKVAVNEVFSLVISYSAPQPIWLDDIRVQPMDSEMSCYVYDNVNLRLLTVFDDQHYGLYYQYNGEGKLVRKLIETDRGIKTIQETQYNTRKTP